MPLLIKATDCPVPIVETRCPKLRALSLCKALPADPCDVEVEGTLNARNRHYLAGFPSGLVQMTFEELTGTAEFEIWYAGERVARSAGRQDGSLYFFLDEEISQTCQVRVNADGDWEYAIDCSAECNGCGDPDGYGLLAIGGLPAMACHFFGAEAVTGTVTVEITSGFGNPYTAQIIFDGEVVAETPPNTVGNYTLSFPFDPEVALYCQVVVGGAFGTPGWTYTLSCPV